MEVIATVSSRSWKKRNIEIIILNEEKLLNDAIQDNISNDHGHSRFSSSNTKKLVLNKSRLFRKWASSRVRSQYTFSFEILSSKARNKKNLENMVDTFPATAKCFYADLRPNTGVNSFSYFRNMMLKVFMRMTNSISLSYFIIDGKTLSKIFTMGKDTKQLSLIRCCLSPSGFSLKRSSEFLTEEIGFSNCRSRNSEWQGEMKELRMILLKIAESPLRQSLKKLLLSGDSINKRSLEGLTKNEGFRKTNLIVSNNRSGLRDFRLLPIKF